MSYVVIAIALVPAVTLAGLAVWSRWTRPVADDFLQHRDDWGAL